MRYIPGVGVVPQFGAHLIAAPTQIGQFRLDATALLFGEVPGSRVLVHARQGTAGLRF